MVFNGNYIGPSTSPSPTKIQSLKTTLLIYTTYRNGVFQAEAVTFVKNDEIKVISNWHVRDNFFDRFPNLGR